MLHVVVGGADCARLLYPDQLKAYPRLAKVPTYVTHNFVPLADIPETGVRDGSLLFIGAPWYIKGVDILIEAFRRIEADYPKAKLRIIGHFPDRDFKDLIGDSRQIEVIKAMPHPEAMEFMANCSIFVLASRTEGMARVLLEAMAAGKPVIAPPVGGIAHYIQDGVTGLLFQPEDIDDLAQKMRVLLNSPELQEQMGRRGREVARSRYDEYAFGKGMLDLVEFTLHGRRHGDTGNDTRRPCLQQKSTTA
jgi:glycosyltransferase involved in cell wall biosynthesis